MKLLIAALAVILATALAPRSAHGSGINLSWDDCGANGTQIKTFACDTNVGLHTMVGSFVAPLGIEAMSANEIVLDLQSTAAAIPAWWQMRTGLCRPQSALSGNWDFTGGPFSCYDYWQGGAIGAIVMDPPVGNFTRIKGVFALPAGDPRIGYVDERWEVYSFKLRVTNLKTTGAGACIGCEAGACIVLRSIRLNQPAPLSTFEIANPQQRAFVSWQCESFLDHDRVPNCLFPGCPTPARTQTWGQIKQLYR